MQNYYEILGLSKTSSSAEIKSAFRKMALQYHPDINPGKANADHFILINEAYRVLSDEKLKKTYDSLLMHLSSRPVFYSNTRKYGPVNRTNSSAHRPREEKRDKMPESLLFFIFMFIGIAAILYSLISYATGGPDNSQYLTGIVFGLTFTGLLIYGLIEYHS